MNCCEKCFEDEYITQFIIDSKHRGNCDYCGSKKVYVAETEEVGQFIREGINRAYENVDDSGFYWDSEEKAYTEGEDVIDLLIYKHCIFSELVLDEQGNLLKDLLSDSGPSYSDIKDGDVGTLDGGLALLVLKDNYIGPDENKYEFSWNTFKYMVKHYARFFDFEEVFNRAEILEPIWELFKDVTKNLKTGTSLWRARIVRNNEIPQQADKIREELGPPPLSKAKNNRMSPSGISYTYLSDRKETCIAEVKPNVGQYVWLGNFITKKKLKLLDLTKIPPYAPDNIFNSNYEHDKNWASSFMDSFATEISRPISEGVDYLNYVPTQVLTEYIRKKGYDGIKYKSSQCLSGFNYTLFCGPDKEKNIDYTALRDVRLESFTKWLNFTTFKEVYIDAVKYGNRKSFYGTRNFKDSDFPSVVDASDPDDNSF